MMMSTCAEIKSELRIYGARHQKNYTQCVIYRDYRKQKLKGKDGGRNYNKGLIQTKNRHIKKDGTAYKQWKKC